MPAPISHEIREAVIQDWISGDTRNKISIDNGIGEGTVTAIVNDWKKGLADSDYESVRELALHAKKQGLSLSDIASNFRLYNFIKKSGAHENQLESFIVNIHSISKEDNLPPVTIVNLVNQLFDISKSESTPLVEVPGHIKQKLQDKQRIEEEIKAAEEILKSKNVSIEAINEHIHLKQELEKCGLEIHDTYRLLNLLSNAKQYEFEPKKIIAKLSSIRTLQKQERGLRNNCVIFARQLNKYRGIIPLAEKIVAMKIGISELLVFDDAVNDAAEQYNLSTPAAAFKVIKDIKDYNKMGGLKKQLATLCSQVYVVKEICSQQNQAMTTLVKLKNHGITEGQILSYLNNILQGNRDKINLESLV